MPTISMKEAVGRAKSALNELYEDDPPRALALEEIELQGDGNSQLWAVTLGFQRKRDRLEFIRGIRQSRQHRKLGGIDAFEFR